jgi:hypothetical protein
MNQRRHTAFSRIAACLITHVRSLRQQVRAEYEINFRVRRHGSWKRARGARSRANGVHVHRGTCTKGLSQVTKPPTKAPDALSAKVDRLGQQIGPDYVRAMDGLGEVDPNSAEGHKFIAVLDPTVQITSRAIIYRFAEEPMRQLTLSIDVRSSASLRCRLRTRVTSRLGSMPNSAEYRRYAEVARRLTKHQQGSNGFMWAQLAALWDEVAKRMAAKEALLPAQDQTDASPADKGGGRTGN